MEGMIANRIKLTSQIHDVMDKFYEDTRNSKYVAWCVGACPYEIFNGAHMARFQTENLAARISSAQEQVPYIEYAEAHGLGSEVCSYAKINIGQALMMVEGKEEEMIPERLRVPKPDMIIALNTCPTMIQWAKALVDIFHVPYYYIDAPFHYGDEASWRKNMEYVKEQLRGLIKFIENFTGEPYDWDILKQQIDIIDEFTKYRREMLELQKHVPAAGTFIDAAVAFGPANTVRSKECIDLYKAYRDELVQRIEKEEYALMGGPEKYRILWRGNFPWFKMGAISRMLTKYGAILLDGGYAFTNYGSIVKNFIPPYGIDKEDILFTIAAEHASRSYTRTFDWKMDNEFKGYIDGYSVDAVIIHSPHTCRPWAMQNQDMAKKVEELYGIPCLVLDSDHTDPSFFHDAQVETRIQSLLEAVDTRRKQQGK